MADHVHMLLSIPPKYSVSGVVGFIKGKSAIAIARNFMDRAKKLCGAELLGEGILRVDGGAGRNADPRVHQRARERRPETRSTEHVQVRDASVSWPDRFERFTNQASGSAGGT